MSKPLALSDSELDCLIGMARPIAPQDRDAFMRECASFLVELPERGPGLTHRIARDVQRRYLSLPAISVGNTASYDPNDTRRRRR